MGALHPEVLAFYELPFVASSLELDIEAFLLD
jgi:phenylalanyl-tRNA synthetase beta subunit